MTKADAAKEAVVASRRSVPRLRVVNGGRPAEVDGAVRWDRVRNARARISAGYYDQPEVKERVLTAVLDEIDES